MAQRSAHSRNNLMTHRHVNGKGRDRRESLAALSETRMMREQAARRCTDLDFYGYREDVRGGRYGGTVEGNDAHLQNGRGRRRRWRRRLGYRRGHAQRMGNCRRARPDCCAVSCGATAPRVDI